MTSRNWENMRSLIYLFHDIDEEQKYVSHFVSHDVEIGKSLQIFLAVDDEVSGTDSDEGNSGADEEV